MKTAIQFVLILAVIGLAYLLFESVQTPIRFERAKKERYEATVQKLKDIRTAELAYKGANGVFTDNWDTLAMFVHSGKLPLVRKIGMLTDSMIDAGLSEKEAIAEGLIIRDTIYIPVIDTLFKSPDFRAEDLKYVPFTDKKEFHLGATVISSGSGVKIPLFQAAAHNNVILGDLQGEYKQEIINLNDKARTNGKYPGLKVGSLEQANNNAGNWE